MDDYVVVYVGGEDENGIIVFEMEFGEIVWCVFGGDYFYCFLELVMIFGEEVIVMLINDGCNFLNL